MLWFRGVSLCFHFEGFRGKLTFTFNHSEEISTHPPTHIGQSHENSREDLLVTSLLFRQKLEDIKQSGGVFFPMPAFICVSC